jgi:two-component system nitrogen regulation response regulator NtrX
MNEQTPKIIGTPVLFEKQKDTLRRARAPIHILLVDDDPVTQALIKNLVKGDYCITICNNVYSAVSEYIRIAPDIVFLDIALGDSQYSGFDVLHTMHMHDSAANVIMISSNGNAHNIARATREGAYGFIAKPFEATRIISYVKECERMKAGDYGY